MLYELNFESFCKLSVVCARSRVPPFFYYGKMYISPDSEDYLTISLAVRLFSLPSISGHR